MNSKLFHNKVTIYPHYLTNDWIKHIFFVSFLKMFCQRWPDHQSVLVRSGPVWSGPRTKINPDRNSVGQTVLNRSVWTSYGPNINVWTPFKDVHKLGFISTASKSHISLMWGWMKIISSLTIFSWSIVRSSFAIALKIIFRSPMDYRTDRSVFTCPRRRGYTCLCTVSIITRLIVNDGYPMIFAFDSFKNFWTQWIQDHFSLVIFNLET